MEAIALAPGIPSLEEQERRDRVPAGTYRRLAETGALRVADGIAGATPRPASRGCTGGLGRSGDHSVRPISGLPNWRTWPALRRWFPAWCGGLRQARISGR